MFCKFLILLYIIFMILKILMTYNNMWLCIIVLVVGKSLLSKFLDRGLALGWSLHTYWASVFTGWPFNKLRNEVFQVEIKHFHFEDENCRYITIGGRERYLFFIFFLFFIFIKEDMTQLWRYTWSNYITCPLFLRLLCHFNTAIVYACLLD